MELQSHWLDLRVHHCFYVLAPSVFVGQLSFTERPFLISHSEFDLDSDRRCAHADQMKGHIGLKRPNMIMIGQSDGKEQCAVREQWLVARAKRCEEQWHVRAQFGTHK